MMQSNFRKQPLSPLSLGSRKIEFGRKLKEKPSSGDEQTPEECGQGEAPETGHHSPSWGRRQNGQLKPLWLPSAAAAGLQIPCWGRLTGVTRHGEASPVTSFSLLVCAEYPRLAERSQKPAG